MIQKLGKCGKPDLFYEDHGILTLFVTINFGASSQGFGGYCLDAPARGIGHREGTAAGLDFIIRLLKLFQVERLEQIEGKPVYALYEKEGFNETIKGLQTPKFDGDRTFVVLDWQKRWFPNDAE